MGDNNFIDDIRKYDITDDDVIECDDEVSGAEELVEEESENTVLEDDLDVANKNNVKPKWAWLRIVKRIFIALAIVLVVVLCYVGYVFATYTRINDNTKLKVNGVSKNIISVVPVEKELTITTYNIGFGAYDKDFSFFMDGGKESRAKSEDMVNKLVNGAGDLAVGFDPDFSFFQEVDTDSTRSYHVNETDILSGKYVDYASVFAVNYHSAYLMYPILKPHGKSNSGIMTFSRYTIESSMRRQFPVSSSFSKILDLDRCYSVSRVPVENGKELVLINLHASAYGTDDSVREGQIGMLVEEMKKEVSNGNYVICGGDFNHDLLADENDTNEKHSWAYPFPRTKLPAGMGFAMDRLSDTEKKAMFPTCRNCDIGYIEGVTFTVTVDGFIISDNIEMTYYNSVKDDFTNSDHEPVVMKFKLK